MKTRLITWILLFVGVLSFSQLTSGQGVIVHKKDGTTIKVPYFQLDSISTYNYTDILTIKTFDVNGVSLNMVYVEGGSFEMGSTEEQSNGFTPVSDALPVHFVSLSDFYIGQTEVTQELWFAVMNESPSAQYFWPSGVGCGDKYPAYNISYFECQEFINKLNNITGVKFRMPTEAEWEYAARGGNKSCGYIFSGSNSSYDVAWWKGTSYNQIHEVATKIPNELGVYDMSGNVWEWCSDWYGTYEEDPQFDPTGPSSGTNRVIRGGAYENYESGCRVAERSSQHPDAHKHFLGIRLALEF